MIAKRVARHMSPIAFNIKARWREMRSRESQAVKTMGPEIKEIRMSERTDRLAEIDERLSIAQENLRQLTEHAAAYSGAEDEELAAQRIKDQEDEIARLTKLRAELTGAAAPRA